MISDGTGCSKSSLAFICFACNIDVAVGHLGNVGVEALEDGSMILRTLE